MSPPLGAPLYHLTGGINVFIFGLCLLGIWSQLQLISRRKRLRLGGALGYEPPTARLSLNQFASSFLAFYSFFVYGFMITPFNHYLVWPRLLATLLTLAVLYQIMIDRREARARWVFVAGLASTGLALIVLAAGRQPSVHGQAFSQTLVVVSAVIVGQGYAHQMWVIRRTGGVGGVSLRMHQLTFLKDVSTVLFGLAMGLRTGWPLLLMNGLCAATKLGVMWQFRWVRVSAVARQRRQRSSEATWAPGLTPFE